MPVMEYNFEGYYTSTNNAGNTTILGKEIANYLKLLNKPQTFDLYDTNGNIATINVNYEHDYYNNHNFIYIRKDLLDKYLKETKSKFVWSIWGERKIAFENSENILDFFKKHKISTQYFQKIVEYSN